MFGRWMGVGEGGVGRRAAGIGSSTLRDALGLGGRETWASLKDGAATGGFRATLASDLEALLVETESARAGRGGAGSGAGVDPAAGGGGGGDGVGVGGGPQTRVRPHHFRNEMDRPARGYVGNYGGIGYDPLRSGPAAEAATVRRAGEAYLRRDRVPYAPVGERAPAVQRETPEAEQTLVESVEVAAVRMAQAEVRGLRALADALERQVRGEPVVVVPSAVVGGRAEAVGVKGGALDLAGRGLDALPSLGGFSGSGVAVLNVSENALVDVAAAGAVANGLEQLIVTGNRLEALPDAAIAAMGRSLLGLYAGRNALTVLPPSTTALVHLSVLMLDGNALAQLPPLTSLRQLRVLSVADNALTELPPDLWTLVNLVRLQASGNSLTEVPLPELRVGQAVGPHEQVLHALRVVDLRDNALQELPEALAFCLLGIRHLGLEGNPVCFPPTPGTFLSDVLAMKPATFRTGHPVIDDELERRLLGHPTDSIDLASERMVQEMAWDAVAMAEERLRALDAEPLLYDVAPLLDFVEPVDIPSTR